MQRETMSKHRRGYGIGAYHSCIIFLLLIIALTPSAAAADTMFRADPQHTGIFDNGGIVPGNTELWRLPIAMVRGISSPAVSNGVVYIGGWDINLYAIDAVTGKEKWRFATGEFVRSSPAVSNGVVYVGSTDNNLYAIDAVTGTERWRFTTGSLVSDVSSSPVVANGVVYVGSVSKNLFAIDAVTGKEKWRFATGDIVYSSPAVANGVVYVGSGDKNLYAIDAVTGTEKWRFATGDIVYSSPAVANGVVYVGSDDKNLYAIDAVTGKERWRFTTGNSVQSSPAVSNGVVYVGSFDNKLYAIDTVTGKERWRFTTEGSVDSSPVVSNGVVYVSGGKNLYAIGGAASLTPNAQYWVSATLSSQTVTAGNPVTVSGWVAGGNLAAGVQIWIISGNYIDVSIVPVNANGDFSKTYQTAGLPPAIYYMVVQVPGYDGKFTVETNPLISQISTGSIQDSAAFIKLTEIINKQDIDDKYTKLKFELQASSVHSNPIPAETTIAPTQVPTIPITQPPTTVLSIPPGDFNLTLSIIVILVVLLLAGGGYAIYRMKRKPSGDQTPVKERVTEPIPDTLQNHKEQTILNQINEIRNNPAVSSSTKSELNAIGNTIHGINLAETEHPLKTYSRKQLDSINHTLNRINQKGMVFTRSDRYDNIRQMIDTERYGEAIVESDKFLVNLAQSEEIYDKATTYKAAMPDPDLISLYSAGKYAAVIKVYEENLAKIDQVNKLRDKIKQSIEDAEKVGSVPDSIKKNLQAQDIETLERTINDLEKLNTASKPELAITLAETRLIIDKWHKVELKINNIGDAHASDIQLAFSDDFETRWVTAVSVKAKESAALSIGIKPKTEGNIPIEITASYKDGRNKDYRQVFKFWIDVAGKTGFDSGGTPLPSPVSAFTPRPLTPKQLPPELSDRYTESEFIGKGGFARVFKAKRKDGKLVAVKIPISLDASTGRSFIAEMQNWTKLDHPNIVRVFDYNIMPMPYFEMELCDSSLAEREKPIESEEAAWTLFNVCEGLKFTHARKIIHRDLKPQNILLKNSVPKISDWGLSRVITESTSTTAASFTPYYAAPEQINNNQKDERTDIWQLGVIFYELVTGQLPFTGDSMVAVMSSIATKNPTLPSAITPSSHDVEAMIMKCLEKNPDKRYPSVLEFQKDLALYLRVTYTESLKMSVTAKDYTRSAYYCGDLVMVNLLTGDMKSAYKYLLDFVHYSKGEVKAEAQELSEQIKMRMEMGVTEIPDELITKAEIIVHQVKIGSERRDTTENEPDSLFE